MLAGKVVKGAVCCAVKAALACEELSPHLQEPINLSLMLYGIWGAVSSLCSHLSEWSGKVLLKEESVTL